MVADPSTIVDAPSVRRAAEVWSHEHWNRPLDTLGQTFQAGKLTVHGPDFPRFDWLQFEPAPIAAISDTTARRIASEWHSGQASPLYAFTSTGTIDVAAIDAEICSCRIFDTGGLGDLQSLRNYVHTIGDRGSVADWPDRTQWS